MASYLRSSLTAVWFLLISATFLSYWLGAVRDRGNLSLDLPFTIGVITIAVVKIRFVFWHFMEVRTAPAWLRLCCCGWLVFLALMLVGLYGSAR